MSPGRNRGGATTGSIERRSPEMLVRRWATPGRKAARPPDADRNVGNRVLLRAPPAGLELRQIMVLLTSWRSCGARFADS